MYDKTLIDLPRTIPNEEPVNAELPEVETSFDTFSDELVDPNDSLPEVEMPFLSKRGPAVRAPIFSSPESRPERTLPRAAREQIARQSTNADLGENPFGALMDKFSR